MENTQAKRPWLLKDRLLELSRRARKLNYRNENRLLESFMVQFERNGKLSPKQTNLLLKFEDIFTDEKMEEAQDWERKYSESAEKKRRFELGMEHFKNSQFMYMLGDFYGETSEYVKGSSFTPSFGLYARVTENKYAQRYYEEMVSEAKYQPGDLVEGRSRTGISGNLYMVVKTTGKCEPSKGSKSYKALLIAHPKYAGSWSRPLQKGSVREIQERHIKKFKTKIKQGGR